MKTKLKQSQKFLVGTLVALATSFAPPALIRAADHGDGPTASNDQACDIADVFFFADPNDNNNLILIATFRGFIVPSEAGNFGIFDPNVRYRFQVENNGNAKPDKFIDVTFSPKTSSAAQTATIKITGLGKFTAPATAATLDDSPNEREINTLGDTGIQFFAGEADDPFFFDIVGFNRAVAKLTATPPDAPGAVMALSRARDSFAGYNVMSIALSIPKDLLLKEGGPTTLGLNFLTQRRTVETPGHNGEVKSEGEFRNIDRMGNPAINVALIPFAKKNKYNASSTQDDADGKFVDVIAATLNAVMTGLGRTEEDKTAVINALAGIAVSSGDFLRLDTTRANTGDGGGDNAGVDPMHPAGFPNGRRLKDDTIDIILSILAGGDLGDGADASDVTPIDEFPFLALPQQPRANGVIEDNTRN